MEIVARRPHTTSRERSPLRRAVFRGLALAGVAGLSLLASACGGGSSGANVAQINTGSASNRAGSSNSSGTGDPIKYSACMRSHGVGNFPDPDSSGRNKITSAVSAGGKAADVDIHSPQFARARKACDKLRPNGGRPSAAQQAQEQQQMLKYAECMRSHGVPKFPDPKPGGAFSLGTKAGVDPNTPQFNAAQQACQTFVSGSPIPLGPPGP
jgi:hypothetical protein